MQSKSRGGGRAGAEVWEDWGAQQCWHPHGVPQCRWGQRVNRGWVVEVLGGDGA